jgi:hypothetical protein
MKRFGARIIRAVELLPLTVPAGLAAFGVVAMVLLVVGQLQNIFVWPLGLLAAVLAIVAVAHLPRIERPGTRREQLICDVLIIAGVLAWGAFNFFYTSQHLFTNRDPATYASAATWVTEHDNLKIDTPQVFGQLDDITNESPGFLQASGADDAVYAQGQHLFPALLGLAGRLVGQDVMLHLPVIFGMSALLAMYGFARQLARPRWAFAATSVLALSLPMIHFSRDTFTEPLTLTLIFGGLTLLWAAVKTSRLPAWFLAGLVTGSSAMVRIDSYITLAGLLLFIILFLATRQPAQRRQASIQIGVFIAGITVTTILGIVDLLWLSPAYFEHHKTLFYRELLMVVATLLVGVGCVWLAWKTKALVKLDTLTRPWRVPALIVITIAGVVLLASRPLWFAALSKVPSDYIASLQAAANLPIEPFRRYGELSVNWITWYVGPVITILGVGGLALVIKRALNKNGLILFAGLLTFLTTAAIYLAAPNIVPDQVWASRRLLPVILPGLLIFAVVALDSIDRSFFANKNVQSGLFFALIFVASITIPLQVSSPFLTVRDTAQLPLFRGVCKALPKNAAVLWIGEGQYYNVQATRSFCNVPVQAYTPTVVTKAMLAQISKNATAKGFTPVVAAFAGDKKLLGDGEAAMRQVSKHTFYEIIPTLVAPPSEVQAKTYEFYLGVLKEDGSITKLR